jgi:Protein of unknown function (DUF4011)
MPWRWRRAVGSAAPLRISSGALIRHGGGTMANSQSKISTAIETSREELLDLGLRTPLLKYRPSRARSVEVVDELPAEVFRILVREGRPMSFEAALQLVSVSSFQVFTDGQWCTVCSIASSGCAELCS